MSAAHAATLAAYRFRVLDKRLGDTHLPLFLGDARIPQHSLATRSVIARPDVVSRIRCRGGEQVESATG